VERSTEELKKSYVELKERVKRVCFPTRCNTIKAHQLMCGFEQVERSTEELKKVMWS